MGRISFFLIWPDRIFWLWYPAGSDQIRIRWDHQRFVKTENKPCMIHFKFQLFWNFKRKKQHLSLRPKFCLQLKICITTEWFAKTISYLSIIIIKYNSNIQCFHFFKYSSVWSGFLIWPIKNYLARIGSVKKQPDIRPFRIGYPAHPYWERNFFSLRDV